VIVLCRREWICAAPEASGKDFGINLSLIGGIRIENARLKKEL